MFSDGLLTSSEDVFVLNVSADVFADVSAALAVPGRPFSPGGAGPVREPVDGRRRTALGDASGERIGYGRMSISYGAD